MKTAHILLLDNYADWEVAYISSTINMNEEWTVKTISTQKEVKSLEGITTEINNLLVFSNKHLEPKKSRGNSEGRLLLEKK
ncbi:glutamine amidotransferase, partial [Streptococcus agalactiae]